MSLMGQKLTNHRGPKSTVVRSCPKADKLLRCRECSLEHLPKRLNRGVPLRERIGFKVRTGMEASMDGETVFGGSAWARCWCGARWRYHPGNCGATWSEYQLCRALP